ncbi:MAG: hypothetical protein ABEJ65_06865, partial [bacterium]
YDNDMNVTDGGEEIVSASKNELLSDSITSHVTLKGLNVNDTYAFGIRWVDDLGHKSVVGDTFDTATLGGAKAKDPVWDGNSWARKLDGTEYLRGKQDYLIRFKFTTHPNDDSVKLHYNALQDGQKPFSGQGEFGVLKMTHHEGLLWETVLPKDASGVSTADKIAYFVEANGLKFNNSQLYYRFNLDYSPVSELGGVSTWDRSDEIRLYWNSSNLSDFKTYRIRYKQSTAEKWTYVDKNNNSNMSDQSTSSANIAVNSDKNYAMNITAVDRANRENWQEQNLHIKRTENFQPVLDMSPDTVYKLYPGEQSSVEVYLEDLDGNPWGNQKVVWTQHGGPGTFVNSSDTVIETATNSNGVTSVDFRAGDKEEYFTYFKLEFPNADGVEPKLVTVFIVPEDKDKSEYDVSASGY